MPDVRPERSVNWHMGWPDEKGPFQTKMIETISLALQKPLQELQINELRLLISQNLALEYIVPVGINVLLSQPMADGGNYKGDLLSTCLRIKPEFWGANKALFDTFRHWISKIRTTEKDLNAQIEILLQFDIEPAKQARLKK